ncbi:hypothetical protein [Pandoraea sp.]|uniref:hypothetical protein n=1 Tax=Pandoraea sp. TaxID=1883445 RepID=UPI001201B476|nr:hypothetical protein [Pandoraea sp.]TAL56927.1 MAG: hypothetical protein EPN80_01890 [Pandoraea sp.]TAM17721.1 MAG: hypothetical protein EPN65_09890 [Pandoraea sp.]
MNLKTFPRGCQLAGLLTLAAMLGGCMTYYKPGDHDFEAMSGKTVYALVRYVHPGPDSTFIKTYCHNENWGKDPLCQNPATVDHISVAVGRNSWGIKIGGMLVPKSARVEIGDIVVSIAPTDAHPYDQFIRVAARAADTKRLHCGWVGSKIAFSGGVVCDGWRYDKDFPLLAN